MAQATSHNADLVEVQVVEVRARVEQPERPVDLEGVRPELEVEALGETTWKTSPSRTNSLAAATASW